MSFFNNNRWLSIITLVLLTANIVTLGYLWTHKAKDTGGTPLPPPPGGQVFEFVTKELQLDSVQLQQYKALRDEHQAGQKPLQDSIRRSKEALFELLKMQNAPDSLVQHLSNKAAAAEQQLDLFTFKHFQKLRAICNATQQKKFDEIIQDVLRRMAPAKRQMGPPPTGIRGGMPPPNGDGPPPGADDRRPPPPDGEGPPPGERMPPPNGNHK
ncbi:Spy/CpxP family protein refolding chaperone [Ferruginibacter sp.]